LDWRSSAGKFQSQVNVFFFNTEIPWLAPPGVPKKQSGGIQQLF